MTRYSDWIWNALLKFTHLMPRQVYHVDVSPTLASGRPWVSWTDTGQMTDPVKRHEEQFCLIMLTSYFSRILVKSLSMSMATFQWSRVWTVAKAGIVCGCQRCWQCAYHFFLMVGQECPQHWGQGQELWGVYENVWNLKKSYWLSDVRKKSTK